MIANLTTPLIGIVSTTAIGRLGDATLLGGVAMASVIFDCLFWLFAFLRMNLSRRAESLCLTAAESDVAAFARLCSQGSIRSAPGRYSGITGGMC